jgi:hypothetical protein
MQPVAYGGFSKDDFADPDKINTTINKIGEEMNAN